MSYQKKYKNSNRMKEKWKGKKKEKIKNNKIKMT